MREPSRRFVSFVRVAWWIFGAVIAGFLPFWAFWLWLMVGLIRVIVIEMIADSLPAEED
jgi:hypothetical protein